MRRVFVFLTGIILSGQALSLEKCVGADGRVSYSDKPCPGSAKRTSMAGGISAANIALEYYDVASPGGHQGRTDWKVSYKFTTRQERGGGCAIDRLNTELSAKIRMPRWNPPAGASAAQVSKWRSYIAALEVHEQGHVQNGRDLESAFLGAARAMRAENCAALQTALRARYDELFRQASQRDVDYDRTTRHGATQGATF